MSLRKSYRSIQHRCERPDQPIDVPNLVHDVGIPENGIFAELRFLIRARNKRSLWRRGSSAIHTSARTCARSGRIAGSRAVVSSTAQMACPPAAWPARFVTPLATYSSLPLTSGVDDPIGFTSNERNVGPLGGPIVICLVAGAWTAALPEFVRYPLTEIDQHWPGGFQSLNLARPSNHVGRRDATSVQARADGLRVVRFVPVHPGLRRLADFSTAARH